MDYKKLTRDEVAIIVAFVVANNPRSLAAELDSRGYNIQGLNIDDYQDLLMKSYDAGNSIEWILNIPYIKSAGNWTSKLYADRVANADAKGIDWTKVGDAFLTYGVPVIGGILGGVLGTNAAPAQQQQIAMPAPAPETIMGINKNLFYALVILLVVIIGLVIYSKAKKG